MSTKKPTNTLHIGKTIRKKLEEIGMTKSEFARRSGTSPQNIYGIFKRSSIDSDLLKTISTCLNFDFFQYYSTGVSVSKDGIMRTASDMQKEIDELKSRNRQLETANGYLNEIYQLQKNNGSEKRRVSDDLESSALFVEKQLRKIGKKK